MGKGIKVTIPNLSERRLIIEAGMDPDKPIEGQVPDPLKVRWHGETEHGHLQFDTTLISEIAPNLYQGGVINGFPLPAMFKDIISLYPWERYVGKHEMNSV